MGTGLRRAFCTSIRRDPETASPSASSSRLQKKQHQEEERSRSWVNLSSIFSGASSNPSTPRGLHSDGYTPLDTPKLQCKTTASAAATPKTSEESPRIFHSSSSSPRSPSRFALLKTALRLSRNRCGICGGSVRQRMAAVFTAECSHAFHFPCISSHVRTQGSLACPVCSATWHEVPLLSAAAAAAARPQQQQQQRERERDQRSATATTTTKIYDDDESLQPSRTSRVAGGGLQFNPIPEESEEDEDDADDVDDDCHRLQLDGRDGNAKDQMMISLIRDSMALVSTGRNHISYVVSIKIKAPQLPLRSQKHIASPPPLVPPGLLDHPSCRAPIDLVTVLDVSGGMTVAKLQMLKRAMRMVISSMGPGDRLCIVAFSVVAAKRLLPLRRMSRPGQRSARQIVDRLVIYGSNQNQGQDYPSSTTSTPPSCVGDALRKATKVLEDRRERNPVATIMLLSDGQTQNLCETRSRSRSHQQQPSSATRFAHIEIPIHASGDLTRENKQQNQRTKSYNNKINMPVVEKGEEENAFAKCVNGLVSVVLQDVQLRFTLPSGGGVIFSVYSYGECDDGGIAQATSHGEGGKSVCIGDLYAEEERRLLVELKVPKATVVSGHAMSMSVVCSYMDPVTRNVIHCGERPLIMPMPMPVPVTTPLDLDRSINKKHTLQSDHQYHLPMLLLSLSSSSSSSAAAAAAASSSIRQQEQQQQLRNLFVTTRAMAESRRLVDLNDMDTALHLLYSARSLLLQQSTATNTWKKLVHSLEAQLEDIQWQRSQQQQQQSVSPMSLHRSGELELLLAETRGGGEPLTPTSAWRAAEKLAKVAIMRKSLNRVSDLHGFENARF